MDWAALMQTHGYWVLAVGCLLEGETILLLAGYAAHRGNLDPRAVIAIAALAGFVGDQFYFWLGRNHGPAVMARWPAVARRADRLERLVERYHELAIIGVRFAYGLRIAGPILIGVSAVNGTRFTCLNAAGALVWAVVVAGIGWAYGGAAELMLGEIRKVEGWLLLALAAVLLLSWWWRRRRSH